MSKDISLILRGSVEAKLGDKNWTPVLKLYFIARWDGYGIVSDKVEIQHPNTFDNEADALDFAHEAFIQIMNNGN